VLPGATVTVTEQNTGFSRNVVTAETGAYAVPNLTPGTYTVTAGVRNNGDNGFSSQILVDNFSDGSAAVPEPAAWALMLTGFFGMGAVLRSNRRKAVFAA